jgi:GH15 family glucan-1,4-alpha-glucosidase
VPWLDDRGVFVQAYGSSHVDASLLLVSIVGFLSPDDHRVLATTQAIIDELAVDGLVARYDTGSGVDGLSGEEGAFLLCSFWLVDVLAMQGRTDEAERTFRQLCSYRNDVGLLAEEIDPATGQFLGNMPQAFSHLGLISSALNLDDAAGGASEARSRTHEER